MRVFSFITILGLLFGIFSKQDSKFSGDPQLYPEELEKYMSNVTDQHEELVEKFMESWVEDSLFTADEQKDIIKLSQKLDIKNARPYPHFVNFLKLYLNFKEKNISSENYKSWVKGYSYYLDSRKQNTSLLNNLLEFSNNLVIDNNIYESASTRWHATSEDYKILDKKGLQVEFSNTNLVCYTKIDSIHLYNTTGKVNPEENLWEGEKGLVTWERGGYSKDDVYAEFKDFTISLNKSEYSVDNVTFTSKIYFDEPLTGELKDKVKKISQPEDADYPQFYSYAKSFKIKDLYKDIDYAGGLSMQGAKLVGTGSQESPASLYLFRNDTLVLRASSLYFGFKADRVSSQSTSISIILKNDSIFHPDLLFNYRINNRELILLKNENFSSMGPYSNSYHKVDMNFDQLSWNLDQNYMQFSASRGASIGNAYFESVNFFNFERFLNLQMMDESHPLIVFRTFSKKYGNDEFPVQALADYLKMPLHVVKQQAMRMAFNGFVFYDSNTETITIKQRLHDYLAASVNKIDYDVMAFKSVVQAPEENAVFNLKTYDLTINGIPQIQVSDSQNVIIYPENQRIVFKHDRNFQFDGVVTAGLMTFFGKNLFFSYDSFKVNLQNVDSLSIDFMTGELNNYGFPIIENIKNRIRNITGEILIDKADNKSGRVSYPQYPIFKSRETSYVYYESSAIQDGAYSSNDFYFAVEPFEMDSLDNFNPYSMTYKGKFVSAGILPDINQELSLQDDNSLGFTHKTPSQGMPVFGGKGTIYNDITLSNRGLKGNGKLEYLTSTTWSDDFNFFPDSMNTNSQQYTIQKSFSGVEYPMTRSTQNYVHWEPYNDVMWVHKTTDNFTMFNDSTTLSGTLKLEPVGLSGKGRMDLRNSDLISDLFTYKADEIFADTSDFYLKSIRKEGFTVLTENINSHIDYRNRKGWFKSNEGYSLVTFPENRYISYIDVFVWDMKDKKLAMGSKTRPELPDYSDEDTEPEGPRYISTDKKQDSLNFVSPLAYYDYERNYINATGVKFIEVADAKIYPKDGLLSVQPDYTLSRFIDARIRANTTTKYHTLHTASVKVFSRKDYTGMGNYDYFDENREKQTIHFKELKVDSGLQTIAQGEIFSTADFTLSPVYKYQGKVFLFAQDSLLTFEGSTKIEHACDILEPDWLFFRTQINPDDIYIPVQLESKNIDRKNIYSGLFVYYDSVHVYPSFLTGRKNYSDRQLIKTSGYLHYDKASHLYKIGSKEKINDFTLSQDYLSLHREDCKMYGEGNIDLGENLGQVKLTTYGNFKHDLNEKLTELDVIMGIDFYISDHMINLVGNEIDSFPNIFPVDLTRSVYKKTMNAWLTEPVAQKIQDELNLFGTIKDLPSPLKHTILLNQLKLVWNNNTNSYQSVGKIGIASINGIQINKQLEGFFELRLKRSGDIMDLYLQLDRRNYYYFGYTRGIMQTLSHNKEYVETIMNMKLKERKLKVPRNETPYNYLISTDRKKNNFYRRWQDILEGNEASDEEQME
ncbi:MAG: hypothetical protein JXA77_10080 [Bacteroidales bacterium]|nr:hypothetical protein [Bacteroidales bacterium]MBN2818305.1 hypothetical protein [Bacteroidales bacterium]